MDIDPRTPVLVGSGQVTERPSPEGAGPSRRAEPVDLMVRAVQAAADDSTGVECSVAGRRLLQRAGSLRVLRPLSWEYADPGRLVADALGIEPAESVLTTTGGNNAQRLVNRTALAIGRGELDVAVVVGADCVYSVTAARRHPDRPVLPWTTQGPDVAAATAFGNPQRGTTVAEEERGLDLPIHVYPLFENALRARAGRGLEEHRQHIAGLWSRFAEVAAANPHAWIRHPWSAEEIATPSEGNRMVAYPYTKLLTANMQVDQGAALLLCSAAAAESAGVPRDRWVFPLAGADADDHWYLSHRADFHSSPAIRLAASSAMALAGTDADRIAHLDLYSCFPSAVQIAAEEIGVAVDDPSRPLTVTGGLTFAGGPGNNYGTHAIASMVSTLRADPGSTGLVSGVGWYLTEHSIGLYGTEPPVGAGESAPGGLAAGTEVAGAAGFRWADPQVAVGSLPQCASDAGAVGEVTVETCSVAYGRDGVPSRAVVACRTPDGRRSWAGVTDAAHLELLVTEECCGRLGTLRPDGKIDLT